VTSVTSDAAPGGRWVPVASLAELWDGEMLAVSAGTTAVVLVNVYVMGDRCPHAATPLSEGPLEAGVLTSRPHEWVFDARRGKA
jgi:nitrite reductase/ring-hydroxylating ferredoxin subunit